MSIVFLCPTGTYASLVAASLLVGKIDIKSTAKDILKLPNFGDFPGKLGIFLYIGNDPSGNMIYTLGISNEAQLIKKSAYDLLKIVGYNSDQIKLYDVSDYIPKYLSWLNVMFPKQGKKVIAQKLYRQLALIDNEIKRAFSKQEL